ncbi:MAG: hypothetical protein M3081_10440 [Gemmatimonadota bacterium]|nr:hypothetical protein [Gemmatimonadota bacterium]
MAKGSTVGFAGVGALIIGLLAGPRVLARSELPLFSEGGAARSSGDGGGGGASDIVRHRTARELIEEYDGKALPADSAAAARHPLVVLIATLPDPIDSHMDWAFDSGIESIRRANEVTGFVTDRFWFPWPASDDAARLRAHPDARPVRDIYPGVMLFRSAIPSNDTLRVILVVGEVPTYGLHVAQLDSALAERDRLLYGTTDSTTKTNAPRVQASGRLDTLRIIGPITSGASPSFRRALAQWRAAPNKPDRQAGAWFVSGGATNLSNREYLDSAAIGLHFQATVHSDAALQKAIERYLARLGIARENIAYLKEGSSYGQGAGQPTANRNSIKLKEVGDRLSAIRANVFQAIAQAGAVPQQNSAVGKLLDSARVTGAYGAQVDSAVAPARDIQKDGDVPRAVVKALDSSVRVINTRISLGRDGEPITIRFPMNISHLRSEYARHPATADGAGAPASPRIPLNLADPALTAESPPVTSELTAPALEFILAEMTRTLSAHRIRAVGILASDVRDKMFLADEVKRRMRDVQLFTFGSNVLYDRQDFETLHGMLVVSTYPLVLESQHWDRTRSRRERLPFQSDIAEGVFNATLLQLGQDSLATDYVVPLDTLATLAPPVWVSAVGNRVTMPLVIDTTANTHGAKAYLRDRARPRLAASAQPNSVFDEYWFLSVMLVLGFLAAYGLAQYRTDSRVYDCGPLSMATEHDREIEQHLSLHRAALRMRREVYVLIRAAALASAAYAASLFLLHSNAHGTQLDAWRWFAPLLVLAVLVFALTRAMPQIVHLVRQHARSAGTYADSQLRTKSVHGTLWWAGILARALVVVLAILYVIACTHFIVDLANLRSDSPALAAIFFARTTAVSSGLSPAVPLILGAIGIVSWSAWHLRRISLLGRTTAFEQACFCHREQVDATLSWGVIRPATGSGFDRMHSDRAAPETAAGGVRSVRRHLFFAVPGVRGVALLVVLLLFCVFEWNHFHHSFEAGVFPRRFTWMPWISNVTAFDMLYRGIILGSIVAISWALYRLLAVWFGMRACLKSIEVTPLLDAFERSSKEFSRLTRMTPFQAPSDRIVDHEIERQHAALYRLLWAGAPTEPRDLDQLSTVARSDVMRERRGSLYCLVSPKELGAEIAQLLVALRERWNPTKIEADPEQEKRREAITTAAEDLVVPFLIDYIEWVFRHLRALAFFLATAIVATTILLWSYPFLPESGIRLAFIALVVVCVGAMLFVLTEINRDDVLSRITHTDLGAVTWDANFILNLILFGVVPLLTLLGAQFPAIGDFLFSWVTPALRAVGRS